MTTQRTTGNDPPPQAERIANATAYNAACRALVDCIRMDVYLDGISLVALTDNEPNKAEQDALVLGLHGRQLISRSQMKKWFPELRG